jgi:hypothetical protein
VLAERKVTSTYLCNTSYSVTQCNTGVSTTLHKHENIFVLLMKNDA